MSGVSAGADVWAVAFTGIAVWCAVPGRRVPPPPDRSPGTAGAARGDDETGTAVGRRLLVSSAVAVLPWLALGGALGVVTGVVAAAMTWRWLAGAESRAERERRLTLDRQLPHLVDLLASTLSVGMSPEAALGRVAAAVAEPGRGALQGVERALRLGRDPARVWRDLADDPTLGSLGRTMARTAETGAPVAEAMHRLAEDLRRVARTEVESRARAVGVRATAPLGACLLPAFVLVGVVPLVAGFSSLLVGR